MSNDIKDVYNIIAKDFDKTRFSVWKGVKEFLDTLPIGCLVGDIGCGNGKNMLYRSDINMIGFDISNEFVNICKNKNLNVNLGDITNLEVEDNFFDHTISIAVIHHLKKRNERIKAISELIRITKKDGLILIYVWAYEQLENSKRKFNVGDNLVTFQTKDGSIAERFYHIYSKGELEEEIKMIKEPKFIIEKIFFELGNWCVIIHKK
jgi:SAM-dependent methyltransferase